ncbi:MAG: DUF3089 domain-containing protein [Myxococcales bacterium]
MTRARKAVGAILAVLVLASLALALNIGRLVEAAMTPGKPFSEEAPPQAPDYGSAASWSALPERQDSADRAPAGETAIDQTRAPVDVFYVHPTSYVGSHWNAPADDSSLNDATDRAATALQATAFNGCCAVWAPRYRQANGTAFYRPSVDGDRAIALAFDDVRRAFQTFLSRRGDANRPFILASHSQGSVLAERLLYEAIAGTPLRDRLVAAYLIGGRVTVDGLRERAPDMPPCRTSDDLHCVVAWNARSPSFVPTLFELRGPDARERLCTNPLTWRLDEAVASPEQNLGAVFLEADGRPRPGFADARCQRGTLVVSKIGEAPRDLPSRVLDHVMGPGNYHPMDYQLFFMNLRKNAEARCTALLATR